MKPKNRLRPLLAFSCLIPSSAVVLLLALAVPAQAALLAYDGFDYTIGNNNLNGAGGTETGFTGNWAADDRYTIAGIQTGNNVNNIVAGLTFGTYAVSGNAVQLVADRTTTPTLLIPVAGREANFNSGNDFYSSYLFNVTSRTSGTSNSELAIGTTQLGTGTNHSVRMISGQGFHNVYLDTTNSSYGPDAVVATTYMFLTKFAYDGTNTTATSWILEAGNYDAIALDGAVTEAELNLNNYSTGSTTRAGTYGITSGEYLQLVSWTANGSKRTTVIDELRIGSSLESVMAIPVMVIPEPSTALLGGLGLLALLLRRRR